MKKSMSTNLNLVLNSYIACGRCLLECCSSRSSTSQFILFFNKAYIFSLKFENYSFLQTKNFVFLYMRSRLFSNSLLAKFSFSILATSTNLNLILNNFYNLWLLSSSV